MRAPLAFSHFALILLDTSLPFTTSDILGTGCGAHCLVLKIPGYDLLRKVADRAVLVRTLSPVFEATSEKTFAPTSKRPRVGRFQFAQTVEIWE